MATPEFATLTTDDLVTGEAVALDLPPAGLGIRIASGLIDIASHADRLRGRDPRVLLTATLQTDAALMWAAFIVTNIVVFVAIPATLETLTGGKSLGKLACGLRTVRDDAGPITFQHAFVRALVGFVEVYVLHRRAGVLLRPDQLARQAARRLRRRHVRRPRPGPAPAAAADADAARTWPAGPGRPTSRRCPPASRSPCGSSWAGCPSIDPQSRALLGTRLADQVAEHVAPPPPPGTTPEAYLAAVVASRRERDQARLAREAEARRRLTAGR